MKLRDMMFLVIGGLLVISGMVLNSLLSGNADAQKIQIEVAKRVTDDNSRHIKGLIKEIQKEIKQGEILKQLDDYKNSQQEGIQDRWFRRQDRR